LFYFILKNIEKKASFRSHPITPYVTARARDLTVAPRRQWRTSSPPRDIPPQLQAAHDLNAMPPRQ
jgi:hypothetical protein